LNGSPRGSAINKLRNLFGGTYASLFFIDCIFHSDLFASIGAGLADPSIGQMIQPR